MSDPRHPDLDARLAELLSDSVSDVEPRDALDSIRDRTKATARSDRRPWFLAVGGAVVATAAVVTAIALATGPATPPSTDPGPATNPPTVASDTPSPPQTSEPAGDTIATGIYYVGDTPKGPRLYREFARVPADDRLLAALELATQQPQDPDYRTLWPAGSFASVSFDGIGPDGQYGVTLADAALHDRPPGMSVDEARMAVEAVIYTVQAAGQTRAPVQFYLGGNPVNEVYGVPTSEPVANGPQLDVLSHMSISDPAEGITVSGSFDVSGAANSNEANVHWQLLDGPEVVTEGAFTAEGWMDVRLFPFTGTVDLTGVAPGTYTFLCETDDPSGGTEGFGPDVDTRTVVVE